MKNTGNRHTLKIHPRARGDPDDIFGYVSESLCNPSAAEALTDETEHALEPVCLNPETCPGVRSPYVKDENIRKPAVGSYIVFYTPVADEGTIKVHRIVYGMSDYRHIF